MQLNALFAEEQAGLQNRVQMVEDAFIAMEKTLDALLDRLAADGHLEAEAELVADWRRAVAALRRAGLPDRPMAGLEPAAKVSCPGCNAVLGNVRGAPGERCDWCGYVFTCICPSCGTDLGVEAGGRGEACPYCRHVF